MSALDARSELLDTVVADVCNVDAVIGRHRTGDGGELNSKHGPTVADALRDLSMALARLANTLDKASPN